MLGDFVKGAPSAAWEAAVRAAILRHRAIDRYTDSHPIVAASRSLIPPERRRFAGILVDIFYDHFLARHWAQYHPAPLAQFTSEVYAVLLSQQPLLPARLQRMLPWMVADDWLASYADIASVDAALNGIARRFRFPDRARVLQEGVIDLERNYASLEEHFATFFPDLRDFVARYP